jgi:integrase
VRGLCTGRRAKTVRYPGGLASSKHPLTLWTARVWRLALMPPRFRALVIFAAFTGLRWGELVALRARDVDLSTGVVHVV